jgi:inosine/xanthosine triphosphatase
MIIAVGTTNPAKLTAVHNAFERVLGYPVEDVGMAVDSGVPAQPMDNDIINGAITRASAAYKAFEAENNFAPDYAVGIEGGIITESSVREYGQTFWLNFQYCVVYDGRRFHLGVGSGFETPYVALEEVVDKGIEFGKVMDRITGVDDIGRKEGGIGYMTKGMLTRSQLTEQAVFMALVPFIRPELYKV